MWVPRSRLGLGRKATVLIVVSLLALSGVGMGLAYRQLTMKEAVQAASTQINVGLTVKAYHPGQSQPFATRFMPHDMILNNFNVLLYDLIVSGTVLSQQSLITAGGGSVSNYVGSSASCASNNNWMSNTCGGGIAIGTSSTAVTATDNAMTTIYPTSGVEFFPITGSLVVSDVGSPATAQITGISGTQSISNNGISIQEAGLFVNYYTWSHAIMLFHDTFSPISVNSGDQVSVSYTISFNIVGFNNNLAKIVSGWLYDLSAASTNTITLTSDTGGTTNFYAECNSASFINVWTTACATASATGQMNIGITTTTTYTPTSYQQYNPLLSTFATISAGSYTAPNCYFTAAITWGTSTNWVDAGLYLKLSGTDYLIMVLSFTAIAQASGTNGATIKSCNN